MSRKVLVAYASKAGATAEIAAAIGQELRAHGHDVDITDVSQVRTIEQYDAVVLGSAIHLRRWRPAAARFLRHHVTELRQRQVWLFHSGPDQDQSMPVNVTRLAHLIGATPAVTFGDQPDPRIHEWAVDISAAIAATQRTTWNRPKHPAGHYLG